MAAKALAFAAEAPPPFLWAPQEPSALPVGVLVISALLLLFGAVAGGLRGLLVSPLRSHFLATLSTGRQRRVEKAMAAQPQLATVAGLVRVMAVFAGILLLFQATEGLDDLPRWSAWVLLILLGSVFLEGIPALVSHGRALRTVLLILPVIRVLALPLAPFTWLIGLGIRLMGADPTSSPENSLAAEMLGMVVESEREEQLEEGERRMISRIMDLPENDAAKVMTPRTSLVAIEAGSSLTEVLELSREEGHSRIPVYEEDLDHVVGVFFVKDILGRVLNEENLAQLTVRECMREPLFLPETMKVPALFEELRRRRMHMAVVVDEYGGTAGVVTVEDLVEEIVGEIEDEHDPEDVTPPVEHVGPGELLVEGGLTVSELNEVLDTELPEDEDFDTVAGLIFDRFGRIPSQGEELKEDGVVMQIVEADDRRIHRIRVRREVSETDFGAA